MEILKYLGEEWRDIKGYEGFYQISNFGRVKSLDRTIIDRKCVRHKKGNLMIPVKHQGYNQVRLSKNGKGKTFKICRLVATAFVPNPENKPCVDHIDGDRSNDVYTNLRWVTKKENARNPNTIGNMHSWKKGHIPWNKEKEWYEMRGDKHPRSKPIIQLTLDGEFIREWSCASEVQRELGYSQSGISQVCRGIGKTIYGYVWKFKEEA